MSEGPAELPVDDVPGGKWALLSSGAWSMSSSVVRSDTVPPVSTVPLGRLREWIGMAGEER